MTQECGRPWYRAAWSDRKALTTYANTFDELFCDGTFEGIGAFANGRFGAVNSRQRMSLQGRRRLLTIFTDTGQPALIFVRPRTSYQSGSSGIRRSNSHPS